MGALHFTLKAVGKNTQISGTMVFLPYCKGCCVCFLSCGGRRFSLRFGWPATEWETGPEPNMAEKFSAKWPAAIFRGAGGFPKWPKMARQIVGQLKFGDFLPAIFRPFWDPSEKWPPAISPAVSRPVLVLGPFPILQQAGQVANLSQPKTCVHQAKCSIFICVRPVQKVGYQKRCLGRGCDEALFSEKKGFSLKRGEAIQ